MSYLRGEKMNKIMNQLHDMYEHVSYSEDEDITKFDGLMEVLDIIFTIIDNTNSRLVVDCGLAIKRIKNIMEGEK